MSTYVPMLDVLVHVGTEPTTVGSVFESLRRVYPEASAEGIKWAINQAVFRGHLKKVGDTLFPAD